MSMQDPISDMLTRIRNALAMSKKDVVVPATRLKKSIVDVLKDEGYIEGYEMIDADSKPKMVITLKYYQGKPVIDLLKSISKPSLRIYKHHDAIPKVNSGLGIAIISTSKGVMSDRKARELGLGGELLCFVS